MCSVLSLLPKGRWMGGNKEKRGKKKGKRKGKSSACKHQVLGAGSTQWGSKGALVIWAVGSIGGCPERVCSALTAEHPVLGSIPLLGFSVGSCKAPRAGLGKATEDVEEQSWQQCMK